MDFFTDTSNLFLCAVSVAGLDLCVLVLILISYCEKKHAQRHWQGISHDMELSMPDVSYPLNCDEILIGRHASADIRLPDLSVSRYHAIMTVANGIWTITDIGSKSGVFVNGTLVSSRRLRENDVINLGNKRLIFRHRREENNVH
ncbi:MAG: FHA domain-containing protein [Ruminococcus sp.]|nr:FHA domain-containing protein [Ruminococcus sp.]